MTTSTISTISIKLPSTPPTFGQEGTATITGSLDGATQARWTISNPTIYGADKKTYILAIVLADQSTNPGVDAGDFFNGTSSTFFLHEGAWKVPNSTPGTAWVAVPPPTGCTLDLVGEELGTSVTLNTLIYLYTVGTGMWWVTSTVIIPKEATT